MKRRLLLSLLAIVLAIQFIPVDRSNPPLAGEIDTFPQVQQILERSCFDCHSNSTSWPWYSYVAPVSWLVAHDVEEGREHLNFSEWESYSAEERNDLLGEIWEEVEDGEMPLWFYAPLHPEAKLSDEDKELLWLWSNQTGLRIE